jgi:UDP-N-acetylmuramoyl-tripeptide--D-alanyl-D-alanine ligase
MEGRRIAVLGDMLELGAYEVQGHRDVGIRAAEVADVVVTVGERGRIIAAAARQYARRGRPEIKEFDGPEAAADFLLGVLQPGDAVLVKGSRALGMERIVEHFQNALRSGRAG